MIAITGAAGFIASNLAERLTERVKQPLLLVDIAPTRLKAANLAGLASFEFLEPPAFLKRLDGGAREIEAIFHLGACSDTTEQDWKYLLRNNVEYSQRLWNWCADHRVPFIYASSAATYGDGALGFDDETAPDALVPLNSYGKSKNEFDRWVMRRVRSGDPAPRGWAGLKFFNVYGPREDHKGRMASMVWHAYRQIKATGEVALFASDDPAIPDGGHRRDFVFVGDCVDQMLWFWRHPEASGLYNCGTGSARTFQELAEATFAALERAPKIRSIPMPADLVGRYQGYTQATISKARKAGYDGAPTALEKGVKLTVDWLKEHSVALN